MINVSSTPFEIRPRREVRFDFSNVPALHHRGNPYLSHFWNALSITSPTTEGLLIGVIRSLRDEVEDPKLLRDLAGFLAQEGLHSRHHESFNARLAELGYDVAEADAAIRREFDALAAGRTVQQKLALVIAGEHVIYEIAHLFLTDPRCSMGMHPETRRLLLWHGAEEMEHQSVAYDTYKALYGDGGGYAMRLNLASVGIALSRGLRAAYRILLRHEESFEVRHGREFLDYMLVDPGFARRLATRIPRFLVPSYEPSGDERETRAITAALDEVRKRTELRSGV